MEIYLYSDASHQFKAVVRIQAAVRCHNHRLTSVAGLLTDNGGRPVPAGFRHFAREPVFLLVEQGERFCGPKVIQAAFRPPGGRCVGGFSRSRKVKMISPESG